MTAWTLGPWRIDERFNKSRNGGYLAILSSAAQVADIFPFGASKSRPGLETATANAHLIAAAPELYEALEAVRQNFDGRQHPPTVDLVNAALAKARGEQP